jgi:hypothetical protein
MKLKKIAIFFRRITNITALSTRCHLKLIKKRCSCSFVRAHWVFDVAGIYNEK